MRESRLISVDDEGGTSYSAKILLCFVMLSIALIGIPLSSYAQTTNAERHMLTQLRCAQAPQPTPSVAWLARERYIYLPSMDGYDSISCWDLQKPFSLAGLPIVGLCVSEDDPFLHDLYPDVYWRGPGTSPGTQIVFHSSASLPYVRDWARRHGVDPSQVEESDFFDGRITVGCSKWNVVQR